MAVLALSFFFLAGCARSVPAPVEYRITPLVERVLREERQAPVAPQREVVAGPVYIVQRGDTLGRIGRLYGIAPLEIARANALPDPDRILPGQRLVLPGAAPLPEPPPVIAERREAPRISTVPTPQPRPATEASVVASAVDVPFDWPVRGPIVRGFGPQAAGRVNDGIDIATPGGAVVRAAAPGEVIYVGTGVPGLGNVILIRHYGAWITAYANAEDVRVQRGAYVRQGEAIAETGSQGRGAQLHFELRQGTTPVDPLAHLPALVS